MENEFKMNSAIPDMDVRFLPLQMKTAMFQYFCPAGMEQTPFLPKVNNNQKCVTHASLNTPITQYALL